ncbi:MAG: protein kinase [Gemmatimonadetes bacterium]|nr:protein kinase [Gemmatimonadota bacterium]
MDIPALFSDLFEIEQLVAESDERLLFVAQDKVLKRRIALRVHREEGPGRAWFLRESEVLGSLDHPTIRHVYAAGFRDGVAYRVGNWIEGESLADAVARGPRPIPAVLNLARDLLSALDHAHVRGVVIRRVRPTTLLLDSAGRGIITDLRFANRVLEVVPPESRPDHNPFLAPEVRGGAAGDPSADIYTVGAVLYYALTGVEPGEDAVPCREVRPQIPQAVERVVMRALRPKQSDRFLTASEMLEDLADDTGAFNAPGAGPPSLILPDSPLWERRLRRALGDDYELLVEIGTGSFGRVYRVRDLRLEREVALKVLDPLLTQDPAIAEGFQREARIAASLTHPNVVSIYDIHGRLGLLWYTMELVRGESVAQLVQKLGPLSVARTVELLDDALTALEYAHARRLVHRDIKPENLLVDPEGRVHVTDFGLALALPRGRLFGGATSRSGTPQFAAPEQLLGGQVDRRTDLYSLGAVGYFCLLGRPPFAGRTTDAILHGSVSSTPPSVRSERDDVPDQLEEALRRACAYQPGERFDDGREFREAIEAAGFLTGERRVAGKESLMKRLARLF